MYIHETSFKVRYAETDKMGIVHHSNYPIWFEVGRTEATKAVGVSYSDIEGKGVMMPLLAMSFNFKAPAQYDDEVVIRTWIKMLTKTRITFGYEALKSDDRKLLCEGETEHAWTDDKLKPINAKKVLPDVFEVYLKAFEDVDC